MDVTQHWFYLMDGFDGDLGPEPLETLKKLYGDGDIHDGSMVWTKDGPKLPLASQLHGELKRALTGKASIGRAAPARPGGLLRGLMNVIKPSPTKSAASVDPYRVLSSSPPSSITPTGASSRPKGSAPMAVVDLTLSESPKAPSASPASPVLVPSLPPLPAALLPASQQAGSKSGAVHLAPSVVLPSSASSSSSSTLLSLSSSSVSVSASPSASSSSSLSTPTPSLPLLPAHARVPSAPPPPPGVLPSSATPSTLLPEPRERKRGDSAMDIGDDDLDNEGRPPPAWLSSTARDHRGMGVPGESAASSFAPYPSNYGPSLFSKPSSKRGTVGEDDHASSWRAEFPNKRSPNGKVKPAKAEPAVSVHSMITPGNPDDEPVDHKCDPEPDPFLHASTSVAAPTKKQRVSAAPVPSSSSSPSASADTPNFESKTQAELLHEMDPILARLLHEVTAVGPGAASATHTAGAATGVATAVKSRKRAYDETRVDHELEGRSDSVRRDPMFARLFRLLIHRLSPANAPSMPPSSSGLVTGALPPPPPLTSPASEDNSTPELDQCLLALRDAELAGSDKQMLLAVLTTVCSTCEMGVHDEAVSSSRPEGRGPGHDHPALSSLDTALQSSLEPPSRLEFKALLEPVEALTAKSERFLHRVVTVALPRLQALIDLVGRIQLIEARRAAHFQSCRRMLSDARKAGQKHLDEKAAEEHKHMGARDEKLRRRSELDLAAYSIAAHAHHSALTAPATPASSSPQPSQTLQAAKIGVTDDDELGDNSQHPRDSDEEFRSEPSDLDASLLFISGQQAVSSLLSVLESGQERIQELCVQRRAIGTEIEDITRSVKRTQQEQTFFTKVSKVISLSRANLKYGHQDDKKWLETQRSKVIHEIKWLIPQLMAFINDYVKFSTEALVFFNEEIAKIEKVLADFEGYGVSVTAKHKQSERTDLLQRIQTTNDEVVNFVPYLLNFCEKNSSALGSYMTDQDKRTLVTQLPAELNLRCLSLASRAELDKALVALCGGPLSEPVTRPSASAPSKDPPKRSCIVM